MTLTAVLPLFLILLSLIVIPLAAADALAHHENNCTDPKVFCMDVGVESVNGSKVYKLVPRPAADQLDQLEVSVTALPSAPDSHNWYIRYKTHVNSTLLVGFNTTAGTIYSDGAVQLNATVFKDGSRTAIFVRGNEQTNGVALEDAIDDNTGDGFFVVNFTTTPEFGKKFGFETKCQNVRILVLDTGNEVTNTRFAFASKPGFLFDRTKSCPISPGLLPSGSTSERPNAGGRPGQGLGLPVFVSLLAALLFL